jgi:hypothetical protein
MEDGKFKIGVDPKFRHFQLVETPQDGNCGFWAIAYALIQMNVKVFKDTSRSKNIQDVMMQLRQWTAEYAEQNFEFLDGLYVFDEEKDEHRPKTEKQAYDLVAKDMGIWLNGALLIGLEKKLEENNIRLRFMTASPDGSVAYNDSKIPNYNQRVILLRLTGLHYDLLMRDGTALFEPDRIQSYLTSNNIRCLNCLRRLTMGLICSNLRSVMEEHIFARKAIEKMSKTLLPDAKSDNETLNTLLVGASWTFFTNQNAAWNDDDYVKVYRDSHHYSIEHCNLDQCMARIGKNDFDIIFFQGCFLRKDDSTYEPGIDQFRQCVANIADSLVDNGFFVQRTHLTENADEVWNEFFHKKILQTAEGSEYSIRQKRTRAADKISQANPIKAPHQSDDGKAPQASDDGKASQASDDGKASQRTDEASYYDYDESDYDDDESDYNPKNRTCGIM